MHPRLRTIRLWWEDGNIIIEAETTRFRVYKGLLVTQSEIFRDMFLIPHPSTSIRSERGVSRDEGNRFGRRLDLYFTSASRKTVSIFSLVV